MLVASRVNHVLHPYAHSLPPSYLDFPEASGSNERIQSGSSCYRLLRREHDMVLTLDPQLAAALDEMARQQGIPAETLAIKALRDRFLGPARAAEPRDNWERRLRLAATDCGVSLPDAALSSEGLYE